MKTVGRSGIFICNFSEDISISKSGFIVVHSFLSPQNKVQEKNVVECSWFGPVIQCIEYPGYTFDKDVSDQAFIGIPALSKRFEGKYQCQVVGNDDSDDQWCNYEYQGKLS
ncbi:hypothetical protein BaRGS_00040246 [Batillaria attramentaria]|uniref:Uncharacterized protein n=1 Tax=Batillaria attramentaria TaxID=370345 RepID=A0ABD0J116_9CAEN